MDRRGYCRFCDSRGADRDSLAGPGSCGRALVRPACGHRRTFIRDAYPDRYSPGHATRHPGWRPRQHSYCGSIWHSLAQPYRCARPAGGHLEYRSGTLSPAPLRPPAAPPAPAGAAGTSCPSTPSVRSETCRSVRRPLDRPAATSTRNTRSSASGGTGTPPEGRGTIVATGYPLDRPRDPYLRSLHHDR